MGNCRCWIDLFLIISPYVIFPPSVIILFVGRRKNIHNYLVLPAVDHMMGTLRGGGDIHQQLHVSNIGNDIMNTVHFT